MIAKHKPGAGRSAGSALKYIEYRKRDQEKEQPEDRHLFSKDHDHVARRDAMRDLDDHRHPNVAYHLLILSPDKQAEPVGDWHAWTRAVMADLEESQGKALHWYAVKHDNTDNPHVHIVLGGTGEDLKTGNEKKIWLDKSIDYPLLRQSGHDHSEYELQQTINHTLEQLEREPEPLPEPPRQYEDWTPGR